LYTSWISTVTAQLNLAYIGQSFLPPQMWPTPCWFECWRHLKANCCRMVRDSATVTMDSL